MSSDRMRRVLLLLTACMAGVKLAGCSPQTPSSERTSKAKAECALSRLACTGLYGPEGQGWASRTLAPEVRAYTPAAELWSDGLEKSRFILLPPGTKVETQDMDEWVFPVGTKLWKEFRWKGKRIETRFLWKRAENRWLRTTYRWSEDESEATELTQGETDVPGTNHYEIPSQMQCGLCHTGRKDGVLGFEAVALSGETAAGLTLQALMGEGLLTSPPRAVPTLPGTAPEQAALSYLHMNCGVSCHNGNASALARPSGLQLRLEWRELSASQATDAFRTAVGIRAVSPLAELGAASLRIAPGNARASLLLSRMSNRGGTSQMPPLGTQTVDEKGVALIRGWIERMAPGTDTR